MGRRKTPAYITDPGRRRAEIPDDDNNHALGALRYLIAKLDARKLGRKPKPPSTPPLPECTEKPKEKKWLSLKNEALWSQIWSVSRRLLVRPHCLSKCCVAKVAAVKEASRRFGGRKPGVREMEKETRAKLMYLGP